jgi:hypothetical protein
VLTFLRFARCKETSLVANSHLNTFWFYPTKNSAWLFFLRFSLDAPLCRSSLGFITTPLAWVGRNFSRYARALT